MNVWKIFLLHKITKIILKSQSFSTNQSRHIGIDFHNFHPIPLQKHTTHYENKQYFTNQFTQSKQNPHTATPISPAQSTPRDPGVSGVSGVSSVSSVSGVSGVSSSLLDQKNACFWSKSEQKRCFKCSNHSNHSKSGAKFHPKLGTCLRHIMEAPPQKHHTLLYIEKKPP